MVFDTVDKYTILYHNIVTMETKFPYNLYEKIEMK